MYNSDYYKANKEKWDKYNMTNLLPMLAHDFKKRGHDIKWPAYAQPKLNGIRCLAIKVDKSTIRYISRGNKDFTTLSHLTPFLLKALKVSEVLDGELFSKDLSFEEIVSAVKRQKSINLDVKKIQYWVYDCIDSKSYTQRLHYITEILDKLEPIIVVPTLVADDYSRLMKFHSRFVKEGYEGTMIRNMNGLYALDKRSVDLQKYKDFIDEEFKIVGGRSGQGKETGCVVFICETKEGEQFECRPRGTYEKRKEWFNDLHNIMGKPLTVRYQNRSGGNIPIFPVGIEIRDYE